VTETAAGREPKFSDDGSWWWDGTQWLPASQAPATPASVLPQAPIPASSKSSSGFPRWLVIVVAIFFLPITLGILIWRTKWSTRTKWILTGLLVAVTGLAAIAQPHLSGPQTANISSPVASIPSPTIPSQVTKPSPSPVAKPSPQNYGCAGCSYISVQFSGTRSIQVGSQVVTYKDPGVIVGSSASNIADDIKGYAAEGSVAPTVMPATPPFASWWLISCTEVFYAQTTPTVVLNDGTDAGKYAAKTMCDANATS
jgi:hypothetical protein